MNISEKVYWITINALRKPTCLNKRTEDASFKTCTAFILEKKRAGKKPAIIPTTTASRMKYSTSLGESSSEKDFCRSGWKDRNWCRNKKKIKTAKRSARSDMMTDYAIN
jgi:hypothetical protein